MTDETQDATAQNRAADTLCSSDQFTPYEQRIIAEAVGRLRLNWHLTRTLGDEWHVLEMVSVDRFRMVVMGMSLPELARTILGDPAFPAKEEAR
jgi:hypothetical protein